MKARMGNEEPLSVVYARLFARPSEEALTVPLYAREIERFERPNTVTPSVVAV